MYTTIWKPDQEDSVSTTQNTIIWIIDPHTEICTGVSPSVTTLTGITPDKIIGKKASELFRSEWYTAFCRKVTNHKQALESGLYQVYLRRDEVRVALWNGSEQSLEITTTFVTGLDRSVIQIICVSRMITAHQTRTPVQNEKKSTYPDDFPDSHIGHIYIDQDGIIGAINNTARQILGMSQAENIESRSIWDLIPLNDEEITELFSKKCLTREYAIRGEQNREWLPVPAVWNGERIIELEIVSLPFRNHMNGYLIHLQDHTKQTMTESELIDAYQTLLATHKKTSLLSSITNHDIINKISAIYLRVEYALEEPVPPETVKDCLIAIKHEITEIESFFSFTRMYQELGSVEPCWQNLHDLLTGKERDAPSFTIISHLNGIFVYADPFLERVFYNLIENSIRHGKRGTKGMFTWTSAGKDLIVSYEDNGVGIPYADKERIFERGFGSNTGLGLYLIREIFAITGCSIVEEGVPGTGVLFRIRIPEGYWRISPAG